MATKKRCPKGTRRNKKTGNCEKNITQKISPKSKSNSRNTHSPSPFPLDSIIKIQKWFRGCILRLKQLPLIMYKIKKYLKLKAFKFSIQNEDGRVNSSIDEDNIIKLLIEKYITHFIIFIRFISMNI